VETFDVRLPDRNDRDRLAKGIEHLQHTPVFSPLGMGDKID
jgi:hypothetical protein